MSCFNPLEGWRALDKNENGKYPLVFNKKDANLLAPVKIACNHCWGCRLDRSKNWAVRCMAEAQLHKENCFITLTFSPENQKASLDVKTFQLFMKKLRKKYSDKTIRFFHCGEYGDLGLAHHHAILFGLDFKDKYLWKVNNNVKLYRSPELEKLWQFGFSTVGACTFETCAYVARYIMKKINVSDQSYEEGTTQKELQKNGFNPHYLRVDIDTGEVIQLKPEYITMSRRPGVAHDWVLKYHTDVYTTDSVLIRDGIKVRPPKYYDQIYDSINPEDLKEIKKRRIIKIKEVEKDNTPDRREVKKYLKEKQIKQLVRRMY